MKVNELRIGNLIEYRIQDDLDDRKDWWEVSKIDATDLCILESNIDYDFRPIPLTEEWLLKFGFEKQHNEDDFDYWFKKGFCDDIFWEHSEGFCHNLNYGGEIKYVHQLQNLYFALTGEELVLKN